MANQKLIIKEIPHLECVIEYRLESENPNWSVDLGPVVFKTLKETEEFYDLLNKRSKLIKSKKFSDYFSKEREEYERLKKRSEYLKSIERKRLKEFEQEFGIGNYHQIFDIERTGILAICHYNGKVQFRRKNGKYIAYNEFYPKKEYRYLCEKDMPVMKTELDAKVKDILDEEGVKEGKAIFKLLNYIDSWNLSDAGVLAIMHRERDLGYNFNQVTYIDSEGNPLPLRKRKVHFYSGFPFNISMRVLEIDEDCKRSYRETKKLKITR